MTSAMRLAPRPVNPEKTFTLEGFPTYPDRHDQFGRDYKFTVSTIHPSPAKPIELIVVPQGRGPEHIKRAATLAHLADAALISMCSHNADFREVAKFLESMGDKAPRRWYAVDVPPGYNPTGLNLTAQNKIPLPARKEKGFNLAQKRNAAHAVGIMAEIEAMLAHDDDLLIPLASLYSLQNMLYKRRIAGLENGGGRDRSVNQHANYDILQYHVSALLRSCIQGPPCGQLSGNSFAFNPQTAEGLNPNGIYNEDLRFVRRNMHNNQAGFAPKKYFQDEYDPYANPDRARREVFGDIFADGLHNQLAMHYYDPDVVYLKEYWDEMKNERWKQDVKQIKSIGQRRNPEYANYMAVWGDEDTYFNPMPAEQAVPMRNALMADLEVTEALEGRDFVEYYHADDEDFVEGERWKASLPVEKNLGNALARIGLTSFATNVAA